MKDDSPLSRLEVVINSAPLRTIRDAREDVRRSGSSFEKVARDLGGATVGIAAAMAQFGVTAQFATEAMRQIQPPPDLIAMLDYVTARDAARAMESILDEMERPYRERRARLVFVAICVLLPQVVYFLTRL